MGKVLGVFVISLVWSFLVALGLFFLGSQVQSWLGTQTGWWVPFISGPLMWGYSLGFFAFFIFWLLDFIVTLIVLAIFVGIMVALGF